MVRNRLRLRRRPPTVSGISEEARPILMLVAGNPDEDPRIGWVRDLCQNLGRVLIKGAVWTPELVGRDYDDGVEVDRFNAHVVAGRMASRTTGALAKLSGLRAAARYSDFASSAAASGAAGRRPPTARVDLSIGGAARYFGGWAGHSLAIDALYAECRALHVRPRLVICHDLYSLVAAVRLKPLFTCPILYDSHEFWPCADLLAGTWEAKLTGIIERRLLTHTEAVVTVSPPLVRLLESYHGITGVRCVPNAAPCSEGAARPAGINRPVRFLLQGRAAAGRGFEQLLEGWRMVDPGSAKLFLRCPECDRFKSTTRCVR